MTYSNDNISSLYLRTTSLINIMDAMLWGMPIFSVAYKFIMGDKHDVIVIRQ
jgi:hypothetical protein